MEKKVRRDTSNAIANDGSSPMIFLGFKEVPPVGSEWFLTDLKNLPASQ
jgi:hypothetical protein